MWIHVLKRIMKNALNKKKKKKRKSREKSGYRAFLLNIQGDADEEVRDAGQDVL